MQELDVLPFVVRLPAAHLQVELARPGVDLRLEVLDRLLAVDRLVAAAEQVQIDTVEDVDAHSGILGECSSGLHAHGRDLVPPPSRR